MSSSLQVDLDWVTNDSAGQGAGVAPGVARNGSGDAAADSAGAGSGSAGGKYLTDEEILGLEPIGAGRLSDHSVIPNEVRNLSGDFSNPTENHQRDSSGEARPQNDNVSEESATAATHESRFTNHDSQGTTPMPQWMQAAAADPRHGSEAQQLWREHQEFRSAFASPEEARAVRELLPGGVRDVLSLREATQSVERIDAALFSGDAHAQAEVVAELARANPAAFRSLFAEAAKVLAGDEWLVASGEKKPSRPVIPSEARSLSDAAAGSTEPLPRDPSGKARNDNTMGAVEQDPSHGPRVTGHESRFTNHDSPITSHQSPVTSHAFDPAAYASFERATNDAVARDVRGAIGDTLSRVLPEGIAEGAAWRIGEDIFHEIHRALAADQTLSEQVASILRLPAIAGDPAPAGRWRFGGAEQQRVASLLAARAKQLVPSVARRVIGEWTNSVLNTARSKAARQAAVASRVDIAAPGGSRDSMPLRLRDAASRPNYASMTDEEILGM